MQPLEDARVDAILPQVPPTLKGMIELQRYTGMRPGEVVELRPCDITIGTDGLWIYRPVRFKTEHHDDAERVVFIGRKVSRLCGRSWRIGTRSPIVFHRGKQRNGATRRSGRTGRRACSRRNWTAARRTR